MRLYGDNRRGYARRGVATIAALLIAAAQLVGAVHSHEWGRASTLGHGGDQSVVVDGRLCAVCQIASHGQAGLSAPPRLAAPVISARRTPPAPEAGLIELFGSSPHVRAPPITG